jgi:hypothetical protein
MENKKLVTTFHKMIEHPKDVEYFSKFHAPLMELMHSTHFTNINHTIPFFGPMLYFLIRALRCEKVLEIGHAEGYSAYYIAHAINDNALRFQYRNAMYYGIDIVQTDKVRENLKTCGLPAEIINMDSLTITPETFKDIKFDLIFQDGAHDAQHVLHEFKTLWPQLKGNSLGHWLAHDTRGPAEEGYKLILEYIKQENINIQHINLDDDIYGLGIFTKV